MMHTLGFFHEHQRLDRDDYVTIHPALIKEENPNYLRMDQLNWCVDESPVVWEDMGSPYDFASIMHYGAGDFLRINGVRLPIIGKKEKPHEPVKTYLTDTFSEQDILQINYKYPCGINECEAGLHNCGENSKCINDIDTFHCECFVGYENKKG